MVIVMMATPDLGVGAARTRNRIVSYRIGRGRTLVHECGHAGYSCRDTSCRSTTIWGTLHIADSLDR